MRGAIGPILTTGVALATAGVVVTNPITATSADVRIPAVALSAGSNDAVSMLDEDFLEAIDTEPSRSANPFTLLRDLISTLAADATHVGKNAIMEAFVAGVTAVSEPELTAVTTPYVPGPQATFPALDTPTAQVFLVPGLDMSAVADAAAVAVDLDPDWQVAIQNPAALVESLGPAVERLVDSTISDITYVGGELIAAAFAAGAAVAAEPVLIAKTFFALIDGDFAGALDNAVKAVIAPLEAPAIIINAVQTVIERRVADLTGQPIARPAVSPSGAEEAAPVDVSTEAAEPNEPATVTVPAAPVSASPTGRDLRPSRGGGADAADGVESVDDAGDAGVVSAPGTDVTVEPTTATSPEPAAAEGQAAEPVPADTPAGASTDTLGAAQLRADAAAGAPAVNSAADSTGATDRTGAFPRRSAGLSRAAVAVAGQVAATVADAAAGAVGAVERAGADARTAPRAGGDSPRS